MLTREHEHDAHFTQFPLCYLYSESHVSVYQIPLNLSIKFVPCPEGCLSVRFMSSESDFVPWN
jgi:hypothetical protein